MSREEPPNQDQLDERRTKVWSLRLRGYSVRSIARKINAPKSTVFDDLEAVRAEVADETKRAAVRYREIELGRLDELYARGFEQLEQTEDPKETASLLTALRGISERRAKLLGLDAPTEVVSVNTNETIEATPERARQLMAEKFGRVSITDVGTGANPVPTDDSEPTSSSG